MGNCGSSSTEAQAPAGPIMVLSHYILSPGEKKDVHAGPQVLSTRHCGTTGAEREKHYVHVLSHATALNYLYVAMHVCVHACVLSWMFTRFLNVMLYFCWCRGRQRNSSERRGDMK